jgi:hypothetical protein
VNNIAKTGFLMQFQRCGAHYFAAQSSTSHGYCLKTPSDYGMILADVACEKYQPNSIPIITTIVDHAIIPRYVIKYKLRHDYVL